MRKTHGFTLLEVLVVLAIIGILATILSANLLNARKVASQRSAQAHGANVYKALSAQLSSDTNATIDSVVTLFGTDCLSVSVPTGTRLFGWSGAPPSVASCTVSASGGDSNFTVTVTLNAANGGLQSINGEQLQ